MPQRNISENVIYLGSSFGTGYVMEMLDSDTMTDNTLLATGLGVGALSVAGSMFIRNPMAENALDGVAAGSFSFVGSKMREAGTLSGIIGEGTTQTAASGSPRVVRVNNSSKSSQQSSSSSGNGNVVEM
jgi:hypothetical protein